jgi:hypothetical protein
MKQKMSCICWHVSARVVSMSWSVAVIRRSTWAIKSKRVSRSGSVGTSGAELDPPIVPMLVQTLVVVVPRVLLS